MNLPVVVGEFVTCLDTFLRIDAYLLGTLVHLRFGVRTARVVDVSGEVRSTGAVDRPSAIDLKEIPVRTLVGLCVSDDLAGVFYDEVTLFVFVVRDESEAGGCTADTEWFCCWHVHVRV